MLRGYQLTLDLEGRAIGTILTMFPNITHSVQLRDEYSHRGWRAQICRNWRFSSNYHPTNAAKGLDWASNFLTNILIKRLLSFIGVVDPLWRP